MDTLCSVRFLALLLCVTVPTYIQALQSDEPPWSCHLCLTWPLDAIFDSQECSGTDFCYNKGESGEFSCWYDKDCFTEGLGMRCSEDCNWGSAQCCDYQLGFTDSSLRDQLFPTSFALQDSCTNVSDTCGALCEQLGDAPSCGVVTTGGYVKCFPDIPHSTNFPTLRRTNSPYDVYFKLLPVVSFGLQGAAGADCTEGSLGLSVKIETHAVMAYISDEGCRETDSELLKELNDDVKIPETQQWGWTGQFSQSSGNDDPDTSLEIVA